MSFDYPYECSCGERFSKISSAITCRKCRTYGLGGRHWYVVDLNTDELVHGKFPTDAEVEFWNEAMRREEEELRKELDRMAQESYEQYICELKEEAIAIVEVQEDNLWAVEDKLMGY